MIIKNKKIMIIGGTGALGTSLTDRWYVNNKILVFSRNEHRQEDMKRTFPDVLYRIGDVKDKESMIRSIYEFKPDIIVNTAAIIDKLTSYDKNEKIPTVSITSWINAIIAAKLNCHSNLIQI